MTNLTGTLYLQTSTGVINQIDYASSFNDSTTSNRTTPWFACMPLRAFRFCRLRKVRHK
ncbi:MAG: hypothetical protein ABSF52_06150 [Syntrophobacteraceae bacterium]